MVTITGRLLAGSRMNAAVKMTVPIRPYMNSGFLPIRAAIGFERSRPRIVAAVPMPLNQLKASSRFTKYLKKYTITPPRIASVMKRTTVSANIAFQGPFVSRSAKSCLMELFCFGSGRTRSRVVAKVITKNTTASAEKMPIVTL